MANANFPSPKALLLAERQDVPGWLKQYDRRSPLAEALGHFFDSRVVFYPGAGLDGQAFTLFSHTHSAHCVVHGDLSQSPKDVQALLQSDGDESIRGYEPLHLKHLSPQDLQTRLHLDLRHPFDRSSELRGALWAVLQRAPDRDDEHGPKRLAFLHVQAEAVWLFWSLWAESCHRPPYAIILQDHGFGGNWTTFGGDRSPLWEIASRGDHQYLPEWLLVASNSDPWPGYRCVSSPADPSRMHGHQRSLYKR